MLHQYINSKGKKIDLSEEESEVFDHLLSLMHSSDKDNTREISNLILNYPRLVHAVHGSSGISILECVTEHTTRQFS